MSRKLIEAEVAPATRALAERLTARARALGEARAAVLALTRRGQRDRAWRDARALWPMFMRSG